MMTWSLEWMIFWFQKSNGRGSLAHGYRAVKCYGKIHPYRRSCDQKHNKVYTDACREVCVTHLIHSFIFLMRIQSFSTSIIEHTSSSDDRCVDLSNQYPSHAANTSQEYTGMVGTLRERLNWNFGTTKLRQKDRLLFDMKRCMLAYVYIHILTAPPQSQLSSFERTNRFEVAHMPIWEPAWNILLPLTLWSAGLAAAS